MIARIRPWVRPGITLAFVIFLLAGGYIAVLLDVIWPGMGARFVNLQASWLRAIPDATYQVMGTAILGYFGAREVGKWADKKFAGESEKGAEDDGIR